MSELGVGRIATVMGRFYPLDRDKRWDRVEAAYNALVLGEGQQALTGDECLCHAYPKNITDEFVPPTVIMENGNKV